MKRNDNSIYFKDWSKAKIIREYKGVYEQINTIGCYGMSDLKYQLGLENEINNRGYEIFTNVDVI